MLVGLPASGKSTYTKQYENDETYKILSSDRLRFELYDDENDQSHNTEVFAEIKNRTVKYLSEGKTVILDATNISRKKRINFIKELKCESKESIYFNTRYKEALIRDSQRSRTVGEEVINRMYTSLQLPVHSEGWDKISFIHEPLPTWHPEISLYDFNDHIDVITRENTFEQLFASLSDFEIFYHIHDLPHDSKWHTFSVGRHTYEVWKYILENYYEPDKEDMLIAALLHDIGKFHTKKFNHETGNTNFYGHEFVGAQLAFNFLCANNFSEERAYKIALLVENHMRLLNNENNIKVISKLKNELGEEMFKKLQIIREADLNAH